MFLIEASAAPMALGANFIIFCVQVKELSPCGSVVHDVCNTANLPDLLDGVDGETVGCLV